MPSKKPRYAQELDALKEVLAGNDEEEVTNETTRIRLQLEFYRRLCDAVFVNAASHIESLDEVATHALNSDGSSPPVLSSPTLLLLAPEYQEGDGTSTHTLFKPVLTVTKRSGRPLTARSKSPQHMKQRTSKHKKILSKGYRVQLPNVVPRDVRNDIVGLIDKAATHHESPFRLAYPWAERRAWYPPSEFQELHRLHYEAYPWAERRAWYPPSEFPNFKSSTVYTMKYAKKARLQLLSPNVETFGYYDFMQRTAAKHSATTARSHLDSETLQENLVTLFRKKDKTAYHRVLGRALDPFTIAENGYASIPELLEQSGALDPDKTPYLLLTTRALACVVLDVKRGRPAKDSWVGNKSSGVWKKLLADRSVLEEAKNIRSAQKAGLYEPEFPNIEFNEDDEDSDFEDDNGIRPPDPRVIPRGGTLSPSFSFPSSSEKSPSKTASGTVSNVSVVTGSGPPVCTGGPSENGP
ncbi:hypothetical protein PHMEG_0007543 [Phytophthora megakarya]|uniref:Uncharacterized protein n=1 Tax=Phytophthora megakarya TaxID=4795 RepID=A0A225WLD1_9STRA|nr:hypothetical protein PHMEG_0007543 [Phytophthora megakarya]